MFSNKFKNFSTFMAIFVLSLILSTPVIANAGSLDSLSGNDTDDSQTYNNEDDNTNSVMSDYLKNYEPVTGDNMQHANTLAGPIANALGTLTGFIMIVTSAGIFVVTALDLAYIGLPFTREFLAPGVPGDNAGGSGMGMGGMGGMPMGGFGMRGGMGMRGMAGGSSQGQRVWISEEAIQSVRQAQGNPQQMGGAGMMMGGMGMQAQQQQQATGGKSAIFTYLKKRSVFIVLFAVCSIVLLSSALTDCGINLAALLMKILNKFNGSIQDVKI